MTTAPGPASPPVTFPREPEPGPDVWRLHGDDVAEGGFVMAPTRAWPAASG